MHAPLPAPGPRQWQNVLVAAYVGNMISQPLVRAEVDQRLTDIIDDIVGEDYDKQLVLVEGLIFCSELHLHLQPRHCRAAAIVSVGNGVLKFWVYDNEDLDSGALPVNTSQPMTDEDDDRFVKLCCDFTASVEQENSSFNWRFVFPEEEHPALRSIH